MDAVRRWWATHLNPPNYRKVLGNRTALSTAEQAAHDNARFNNCLRLITAKGLHRRPDYNALITSGTLRFLTQTTTPLRDDANAQAHFVLDTNQYRALLHEAVTDPRICPAETIGTVSSILDFVEAGQNRSV